MITENNAFGEFRNKLLSTDVIQRVETITKLVEMQVDDETVNVITQMILIDDNAVRNAATDFLTRNSNNSIPFKVVDYISFPEISIRNLAGEILIKRESDSLDAIHEKLLRLENDDDIKFLVDVLGVIGNQKSEQIIIEILQTNQNENVIVACIEALGTVGTEKAINFIFPFYEKGEAFKPVIIESAGKINAEESLEFITNKLDTADEFLKFIIIENLGNIGDEIAFYSLLSHLDNASEAITWVLLEAVYKLKVKYSLDLPFDDKIKKCILETLIHSEPQYQIIAAQLIADYEDPEILLACLKVYGLDEQLSEILHHRFMKHKGFILTKIHKVIKNSNHLLPQILELLQHIIHFSSGEVEKLSSIDKRKLVDSITNCLTSPDEVVRILAYKLLFNIDKTTAVMFLDTMLNDENIWNRLEILDLLNQYEDPGIIEIVKKILDDPEDMVSEKAKELIRSKQNIWN